MLFVTMDTHAARYELYRKENMKNATLNNSLDPTQL